MFNSFWKDSASNVSARAKYAEEEEERRRNQAAALALLGDSQVEAGTHQQNPDGSVTKKSPSFLDYLNPLGEHGLFGQRNTANVANAAEQGGDFVRKKVDQFLGEEGNDKFDSGKDAARFAINLLPGMVEGFLTSGKNFNEAARGERINFDEQGNMLDEKEKLTGRQRFAAGVVGGLDTGGLLLGGSGKFLKEIFKSPLKSALKKGAVETVEGVTKYSAKSAGKKAAIAATAKGMAKNSFTEGVEESVQSFAEDFQIDDQLSEDWLATAGKSFALGAAGGSIFDVSGRAFSFGKSKIVNRGAKTDDAAGGDSTTATTKPKQANPTVDPITPEKLERLQRVDGIMNQRLVEIEKAEAELRNNNDPSVKRIIASDGTDVTAVAEGYDNKVREIETQIRDLQGQAEGIDTNTGMATIPDGARYVETSIESELSKVPSAREYQPTTGDKAIDAKVKQVVEMSPDEYLQRAFQATDGRLGGTYDSWLASNAQDTKVAQEYAQAMQRGDKFPLAYLDEAMGSQDGRNRAIAAKLAGRDKMPVAIVPPMTKAERIAFAKEQIAKHPEKSYLGNKYRRDLEIAQNLSNDSLDTPTNDIDPSTYTGDVEGRAKAAEKIPELRQKIEDLRAEQAEKFEMLGGAQEVIDTQAVRAKAAELKRQKAEVYDWKIRNNLGETVESLTQLKSDLENGVVSDQFVKIREPVSSIEGAVALARDSDHNDTSSIQRAAVINQLHREAAQQKLDSLWTDDKAAKFEYDLDENYRLAEEQINEYPGPKKEEQMLELQEQYDAQRIENQLRVAEDADEVTAAKRALEIADDIDERIVDRANSILESNPAVFGKVDPEEMIEIESAIDIALTLKKVEQGSQSNIIRESDLSTDDSRRSPRVTPEQFQVHYEAGRAKMEQFNNTKAEPTAIVNDEQWGGLVNDAYNASREEWGGETYNAVTGEKVAKDADAYALTIRDEGMDTVSISPTASKAEFAEAMETAKQKYAHILERKGAHLGVFNDADTGRIDIDPVMITEDIQDVHDIGAYTRATGGAYHFKSGDGFWPPHVANDAAVGGDAITPIESEGAVTQAIRNAADAEEAGIIIDEDPRLADQAATVVSDQLGDGNLKGELRDTFFTTVRSALLKLKNGDKLVGELDYALMEMAKSDDIMKVRANIDKWSTAYKTPEATDQSIAFWDQGQELTQLKGESNKRFAQRQKAVNSIKEYFDDAAKRRGLRTNAEADAMVADLESQRTEENSAEIDAQIQEINSNRKLDNYFAHIFDDPAMKDVEGVAEALARLESGINAHGNKLTENQRNKLLAKVAGIDLGTQQIIAKKGIYKVGKDGHAIKREGAEGWSRDIPFVLEMYQRSTNRSVYMQPALDNIKSMTSTLGDTQREFVEDALNAVAGKKSRADRKLGTKVSKALNTSRRFSNMALMGASIRTMALQPIATLNNARLDKDVGGGTVQYIASTLKALKVTNVPIRHSPALQEFLMAGGMQGSWSTNLNAGKLSKVESALFGGITLMDRNLRFAAYDMGKESYLKNNAKDPKKPTDAEYNAAKKAGVAAAQEAQFGLGPMDVPLAQTTEVGKSIFQLQQFNMKQLGREAEYLVGKNGVFRKNGWIDEKTGNLNPVGAKNLLKTIVGYSAIFYMYTQFQVGDDEDSKNPFGLDFEDMIPFGEQVSALVEFATTGKVEGEVQTPLPPVFTALVGRGGQDKGVGGHLFRALVGGEDVDRGDELSSSLQAAVRQFMPMGTQLNRSYQGGKAVVEGESQNKSGSTRFLVDNSSGWNIMKGLVAGQYATTEGQEWLRNGMNTIPKNKTLEFQGRRMPVSEFVRDHIKDPAMKAQFIGYYSAQQNANKELQKVGKSTTEVVKDIRLRLTAGRISQAEANIEIERHNQIIRELYRPYFEGNKNIPKYVTMDFLDSVMVGEAKPYNFQENENSELLEEFAQ